MHQFKIGDKVCLRTGKVPQTVLKTRTTEIQTKYSNSELPPTWRNANDFYSINPSNEKEIPVMSKLFQVTAEPTRYGTQLATSTTGHIVLEMKPEGTVEAFEKAALTEVRPYTVQVTGGAHVVVPAGSLEVGDILVYNDGSLTAVHKLDTKADKAINFDGRKIKTQAL